MLSGRATTPSDSTWPAAVVKPATVAPMNVTRVTAPPQASHFSCCRRSPDALRQRSTWCAANDSQMARTATTMIPWIVSLAGWPRVMTSPVPSSRTWCPARTAIVWARVAAVAKATSPA